MIRIKKHEEKSDFIVLTMYTSYNFKPQKIIINKKQNESVYTSFDNNNNEYTQVNIIGDKFGYRIYEKISEILNLIK
ncbi:MAG: hypothetical protein [Hatfieldvirus porci]|uniref:Uncharacterized protein n=1 Tax=phage Lak_Megaphage_RVC_JS4_GC31 TaxID=3109228 RepID=A0ABZ0Z1N1_9CAUD|nr:MAG: hypothetical protein [phage Lak_Megaphage_RVC_AP3_GC31]WQJ53103.1 MAG: hypothetical protein [phage Lak_Megaphage_RVC_JS4_GC31]